MSNRTNQTLSAITYRLNLGTRSLALVASGNDKATQRFRLAPLSHPGVVERVERMRFQPTISRPASPPAMPEPKRGTCDPDGLKSSSRSLSLPARRTPSGRSLRAAWTQGQVVSEAPSEPRSVVVSDVSASWPAWPQGHGA
jgi:hypothetical protein